MIQCIDICIDWCIADCIVFRNENHIDYHTLVQISVSLCKDQPNTPLLDLMRRTGVLEVQRVLGEYVYQLKSGLLPTVCQDQSIRDEYDDPCSNMSDL